MPMPLSIVGAAPLRAALNGSQIMKKAKLWYVIADGGRARFVERDEEGAFRTLSSFVSTELHKSAHELGRDRPARVKESASPARSRGRAAPRSA